VRWFGEADAQLGKTQFLAGEVSLADFALFPIVNQRKALVEESGLKNLSRWWHQMSARPAVQKGLAEST
jgi:GST-like protein